MPKASGIVRMKISADPIFIAKMKKAGIIKEGRKSLVFKKRTDIPLFLGRRFKSPVPK